MRVRALRYVNEQRGIVLVLSLFVLAILSILGMGFLATATTEHTVATNWRNQTQAFYAAEGALESGLVDLRSLLRTTETPSDAQLSGILPRPLNSPILAAQFSFDLQVRRVRSTQPFIYNTVIASGPYQELNALTTDYQITAQVSGPRGSRARLTQRVQHVRIPLFQFGAFYGEGVDFEVYAGPTFWFSGRVHANSDIYLADSGSNGMLFDSYVTAVGNFYRHRKDQLCCDRRGNPDIKDAGGTYRGLDFDRKVKNISADGSSSEPADLDYWRTESLKRFGGRVQDSAHGVAKIIPPIPEALYDPENPDVSSHLLIEQGNPSDTPALKDAKMYYEADMVIENTYGRYKDGKDAQLAQCKDAKGKNAVRQVAFYDAREKIDMTVTEIDVGALVACNSLPSNGVLYVSRPGYGNKGKGVRLVNGSQLPSEGLTVVSENPVYIQGDYNTVNKVPAAVIADAVTVLSSNWETGDYDAKGNDKTSKRPAGETTVNAAIATGPHDEAAPGAGNGEFNNVIRFLEDWNGVKFNYNGSVVALWHSQQANTPWRCCGDGKDNYYRPPNRNWAYDTLFDTSPPPGTPSGILTLRGQWSEG